MRLANIQGYSIYLEILEILKSLSGGKWISWVFLSALEITESWVWENSLDLGWTKASDEEIPDVGMDIKKQWVSPVFLAPRHLSENGVCPNSDDARPWSSALLCTARWHGGGTQRGDTWGQPSGGGGFVTSRAALWGPPAQRCRGRVTLLRMETPGGQTAKQCPERRAGVLWLSTFFCHSRPLSPFPWVVLFGRIQVLFQGPKFSRFPGQNPSDLWLRAQWIRNMKTVCGKILSGLRKKT